MIQRELKREGDMSTTRLASKESCRQPVYLHLDRFITWSTLYASFIARLVRNALVVRTHNKEVCRHHSSDALVVLAERDTWSTLKQWVGWGLRHQSWWPTLQMRLELENAPFILLDWNFWALHRQEELISHSSDSKRRFYCVLSVRWM